MPKKHSLPSPYYKIGLGHKALDRARLIFFILILLVIVSLSTAVYVEAKTGQLGQTLNQPLKQIAEALGKTFESSSGVSDQDYSLTIIDTSPKTNPEVTAPTKTPPPSSNNYRQPETVRIIYPTYPPLPTSSGISFEERVKEMREQSQVEYEAALKRQQEWSTQKKAESEAWFQQKILEQEQQSEKWKQEHGFTVTPSISR